MTINITFFDTSRLLFSSRHPTLALVRLRNSQEPSKKRSPPFSHQLPKHSDTHLRFLAIYQTSAFLLAPPILKTCILQEQRTGVDSFWPLTEVNLSFERNSPRISPWGCVSQRCQSHARMQNSGGLSRPERFLKGLFEQTRIHPSSKTSPELISNHAKALTLFTFKALYA